MLLIFNILLFILNYNPGNLRHVLQIDVCIPNQLQWQTNMTEGTVEWSRVVHKWQK